MKRGLEILGIGIVDIDRCYVRNKYQTRRIWKSKAKSTTL